MPKIGFQRVSEAPALVPGDRRSVELPRTGVIHSLMLRVRYTMTIVGGTGAGDAFADAAARLIEEVRLVAGKRALQTITGQTLALLQTIWGEEEYAQTPPTTDAVGAYTDRETILDLIQYMPHSYRPHAFAFPAQAMREAPTLEVVMANGEALFTPTADFTSATISAVETDLFMETLEGPEHEVPRNPVAQAQTFVPLLFQTYRREVTGSSPIALRLDGWERGQEARALIIETFAGGVNGARYAYNNALVEEVRLELDDDDVYGVVDFDAIRQRNKKNIRGLTELLTGVAVIDAAENQLTDKGQLFERKSATAVPVLHLKAAKQAGDCLIRVTLIGAIR
jgi:hypothetical protein